MVYSLVGRTQPTVPQSHPFRSSKCVCGADNRFFHGSIQKHAWIDKKEETCSGLSKQEVIKRIKFKTLIGSWKLKRVRGDRGEDCIFVLFWKSSREEPGSEKLGRGESVNRYLENQIICIWIGSEILDFSERIAMKQQNFFLPYEDPILDSFFYFLKPCYGSSSACACTTRSSVVSLLITLKSSSRPRHTVKNMKSTINHCSNNEGGYDLHCPTGLTLLCSVCLSASEASHD